MPPAPRLTAKEVTAALYDHYVQRYAFLTEVPAYGHKEGLVERWQPGQAGVRFIDVLLLGTATVKYERIAIEIKVDRGDFLRDTHDKRGWWMEMAHRFAYAVPEGLVSVDEVPEGCGLLYVGASGVDRVRWAKRAPRRETEPLPLSDYLLAYFVGRASRAEALLKGYDYAARRDKMDDPAVLRRMLAEATAEALQANGRARRERDKRQEAAKGYAAVTPQTCATCAEPVRLTVRSSSSTWVHRKREHDEPCLKRRTVEAEERERARLEAALANPDASDWERRPRSAYIESITPSALAQMWTEDAADPLTEWRDPRDRY